MPMKSPIRLMSGLRSFALPEAPPKVSVCVACVAAGAGGEETIPGSAWEEASRICGAEDCSGDFVSRRSFNSVRRSATSPASLRTCSSSALIRDSSVFEGETSRFLGTEAASCARAIEERRSRTDRTAYRFMTLLLEFYEIELLL